MKCLRVLLLVTTCAVDITIGSGVKYQEACSRDVVSDFSLILDVFAKKLIKAAIKIHEDQFIVSAYSAYMMLAAIAEGATGATKKELYKVLQLPKLKCHREEYYKYALEMEPDVTTIDVTFTKARLFALDKGLTVNETWAEKMTHFGLLDAITIPNKDDPCKYGYRSILNKFYFNSRFQDSSVLFDSLNYSALWRTTFPREEMRLSAPFYNDQGQNEKLVDMLYFRKRAKMGMLKKYQVKYLILPVGEGHTYNMIFYLSVNKNPIQKFIENMPENFALDVRHRFEETYYPIEIAIPEITFRSNRDDMHLLFQELGIKSLWNDPSGTSLISDPPAMPSGFVQNVVVKLERYGVEELTEEDTKSIISENLFIDDDEDYMFSFFANKPFLFTLVNNDYKVTLFAGIYSGEDL